jgi:predicted ATPase/DNA-binding CsgD family transcriptional regulator
MPRTSAAGRPRGAHLPLQATPLIDREEELAGVCARLRSPDVRLLTLVGPPGIGKTRLAVEAASVLADEFAAGAAFVDLAPIATTGLVVHSIAQALGVTDTSDQPLLKRLSVYLAERQILLVLDNFEHVMGAAGVIAELLSAARDLKVLATSREPLRLTWEHQITLQPLSLPDLAHLPPLDALRRYPSVDLFIARARAVDTGFALTPDNAGAVAEICVRLDGLPLAIELAAPRVKLLTPQAILERLGHRLSLLTRSALDLPERHRTLRGAIGWSYALLQPSEQALFRRLAAFTGGATLEAGEQVCGIGLHLDGLEGLASLVDKSLLVRAAGPNGSPRFRMLETIREFGLEQLDLSGETDDIRRRHAMYFLNMAEGAERDLHGPEQAEWLERFEADHGNFRSALAWSRDTGDTEGELRLVSALERFWVIRGHFSEGREWLRDALDRGVAAAAGLRARVLDAAGHLAFRQGDYAHARALYDASLALRRSLGDRADVARSLYGLARAAGYQGDTRAARAWAEESLTIQRDLGNTYEVALTLNALGEIARTERQYPQAYDLYSQSLEAFRTLGDQLGIQIALHNLGHTAVAQARTRRAIEPLRESLDMSWRSGIRMGIVGSLAGLGAVAAAQGQSERAARILGAAEFARATTGFAMLPMDRETYDRAIAAARRELSVEAFEACWSEGRAMSLEEIVAYAMRDEPEAPAAPRRAGERPLGPLSRRESEIAALVAQGRSNREIAATLYISERTAANHVQHILDKLGLHTRAEIAAWAVRRGLGPTP